MLEGGGVVEHRVVVRDVVVCEQVVDVRVFAGDPVDVEALVLERVSGVDAGWAVSARRVVADRWYASSKTHHLCGCRLIEPRRLAKHLVCAVTGELVDRDHNAALNLRDWPDHASCSSVGAAAPNAHQSASARTTTTGGRGRTRKTNTSQGVAKSREARTEPTKQFVGAGTSRRGATR